jgi:hypothetical protein
MSIRLSHGCAKDRADHRSYQIVRSRAQWNAACHLYAEYRKETRRRASNYGEASESWQSYCR